MLPCGPDRFPISPVRALPPDRNGGCLALRGTGGGLCAEGESAVGWGFSGILEDEDGRETKSDVNRKRSSSLQDYPTYLGLSLFTLTRTRPRCFIVA